MPDTILQFSGGKDSLACLYHWRDKLADTIVVYVDTGAVFPHVRKFVEDTCRDLGADLQVVTPMEPIRDYHARVGVPSDIVPVYSTAEMAPLLSQPRPIVNSTVQCCIDMLIRPLHEFSLKQNPEFIVRGSKKADRRVGVPHGHVQDGITYLSPMWDMTDADVLEYLNEVGAALPAHYEFVNDSLDCYLCSGHLTFGTGRDKIEYTRKNFPELWPELERNLALMASVVAPELALVTEAIGG